MRPLLTVLLPLLLVACSGGDKEGKDAWKKKARAPITVVETAIVQTGSVADILLASAVIEAQASADLMPVASGMVLQVTKDVGDAVRKGELLAIIDNVQLDAGAERARAEVKHLTAQVAEMERLYASGAVSERELADLRYRLDTARTTQRETASSAGETRLTAPFAGVVASREVKVGELASSARRAFQIVDLSELRLRASLPERDVGRVAVGQRAQLVSAYDEALTGTAEVSRISPVIDATTGTFEVTLVLDKGPSSLRPGQFVSVQLEVDRHDDVVVVPKNAVVYDNGNPTAFLYVEAPPEEDPVDDAEEDAKGGGDDDKDDEGPKEPPGPKYVAKQVALTVGLTDTRHAEIVEGLSPGDRIVVIGQGNLREGARIREAGEAVPEDAAQAAEKSPDGDEG